MSSVNAIRSTFLDFFHKNGHEIVASSPLVPRNDPTLMFTNAGMVQFKNVFTGLEQRPYTRAASSQKCVRAGGKHNDLDNVGYTARHHTFFEMLGNFSFGDYFKADAIDLAWRLITKEYGLSKDKLSVTVYHNDDEAFNLWKKIGGLPDERIIRIATSDNFWAMGDTGPCGPCSEIFYDHGPHIPGGPPGSAEQDGDRFIEIWNLVFMQFEQLPGERIALPKPSIDTGMGLERISAVLQGTHDNYETDMMQALVRAVCEATSTTPTGKNKISQRVIADHLRSTSFLIADGVLPSNEGRGYVLRRIMRRAMRHAELLGAREPVVYKLVPALVREMGAAYPELVRAESLITETLKLEETRFRKTLERGLLLLEDETRNLPSNGQLRGDVAFKLYDTYGFPLDLTQDALRARDLTVDVDGFNLAMEKQKSDARAAWSGSGEASTEAQWYGFKEQWGATEFLGYDTEIAEGSIFGLIKDGCEVGEIRAGDEAYIITNQTPFYAESGGQRGDTGVIFHENGQFIVSDTQKKLGALFVHAGSMKSGILAKGNAVEMHVDHAGRSNIRAHHSATHLLHEALRETLGDHVAQKGSLVEPARLRFDISHMKPISAEELQQVEARANEMILQNAPVVTRLMAVDDAIASGARALFGEKYGEEVRVVSMGKAQNGKDWSVELCGGTHVSRTGDIGLVSIVGESAVAAGVRRIEAVAGITAREYLYVRSEKLAETADILKVSADEVPQRVAILHDEKRRLEREVAELRRKVAMGGSAAEQEVQEIKGVKFMGRVLEGVDVKDLKPLADEAKAKLGSGVVVLIAVAADQKAGLVVAVTPDLTARFNAVDFVRIGAEKLGGKGGGGRPDMAQAGGPNGAAAQDVFAAIAEKMAG